MENKKTIFFLIITLLIGLAIYSQKNELFKKAPNVIWEKDDKIAKEDKRASIDKVVILKEICNNVELKITYNNSLNETDGHYRITASHMSEDKDYTGYRGDHSITINKGLGEVSYNNWVTNERDSASTYETWVTIEEIVDNRFKSIVDRVKIKYNKNWNHSCI